MRKTIGLAFVIVVAGVVFLWRSALRSDDDDGPPAVASAPAPRAGDAPPTLPGSAPDAPDDDEGEPPELPTDGQAPYPVDLDALRKRMPENRYWALGAPTKDPEVLRAREERKKADNALLGKILSSTATEREIEEYYAERQRVSEDYMKFAAQVLADHRDELPERDVGLYELTIRLHRGRLDQIPRDKTAALERLRAKQSR